MFRVELGKASRRIRTYVMAALLASVPALVVGALVAFGPPPDGGDGFITLVTRNGLFAPVAGLVLVEAFLLPLAAGLLAGDAIAGEAAGGTLRYLLVRPVRRVTVVVGKYAAVLAVLALLVAVLLLVGAAVGTAAFGIGPLTTLSGSTVPVPEAVGRIAVAGLYAVAGVGGLAAIGLFISSLTESGPGATVATVAVAVVGQILGALSSLEVIHPFLLNTYSLRFIDLFRSPVSYGPMLEGLGVFSAYAVVFVGLATLVLTRRDVLS